MTVWKKWSDSRIGFFTPPPTPPKSLSRLKNGRMFGPQSLSGICEEENKANYKFIDISLVTDRVRLLDWLLG